MRKLPQGTKQLSGTHRMGGQVAYSLAHNCPTHLPAEKIGREVFASTAGRELSRYERRELDLRLTALQMFGALIHLQKKTRATALTALHASGIKVSAPTLWRWETAVSKYGLDGLLPQTARCGRTPTIESLEIPQWVFRKVRRLQLAGIGNAAAWRQIGRDRNCPKPLSEFLARAKSIPPSLLAQTRLQRRKAVIVECADFTVIKKP